jgi:hypothetical protein
MVPRLLCVVIHGYYYKKRRYNPCQAEQQHKQEQDQQLYGLCADGSWIA